MAKSLAPAYRPSKSGTNTLLIRGVHKLLPHGNLTPRFDPLFTDGPNRRQIQANWSAWREFRGFRADRIVHVGVIADSRGGSHIVQSQFHYLRCAFCFGGGFAPESPKALNFRAFLLRGIFGVNSLQSKTGREISHLFYLVNNRSFPARRAWQPEADMPWPRYWLFVFRNPLRCLLSMAHSGKSKWRMTGDSIAGYLDQFRDRLLVSARMELAAPERVMSICYEGFVQQPDAMLHECCDFLGVDRNDVDERLAPRAFFQRFQRCGSIPEERDGYLVSPVSGERIAGTGGGFNPLSPIDPARALMPPLEEAFPAEFCDLAADRLGRPLYDIYMADRDHRFQSIGVGDLQAAAGRR